MNLIHHDQASLSYVLGQKESDKLALLAVKNQIIRDPFGVTSSWNESLHFCMWQGVSCSQRHQRVIQLNLRSLSMVGYIHSSIGNLTFLRVIDLSNNSFQGEVPQEIGHLFRLREIALANNSLRGQIPSSLSNCSSLRILDLSYNKFTGVIPFQLGFLSKLERLHIKNSNLKGSIPPHMGNISTLLEISMRSNLLEGEIPESLGQLKSLTILSVGNNMLSGTIPQSIYNLSNLSLLSLCENEFQGSFPHNIGLTLPNIQYFNVWENQFSGSIPVSFSNTSKLLVFDISNNKFFGKVPRIFENQEKLWYLRMADNDLGSSGTDDLYFLTPLANCSNLKVLEFSGCNFGGVLPSSLGNLSAKLESLELEENQISGVIPSSIGNLISLNALFMYDNKLKGTLPATIGRLHKLETLDLHNNELYGEIPSFFENLTLLNELRLDENNFHGSIPSSLGMCQNLLLLNLSSNSLNGTIPKDVIGLSSLSKSLNLSRNHLTGSLPWQVGELKNLVELDVSTNELSGDIPSSLGDCTILERLYMDHNNFEGAIPGTLYSLKGIEEIDLSHNKLSGHISKDLAKLTFLSKLNLSFNDLEGEVPIGGVFSNFSEVSIAGNDKLCGGAPKLELAACSRKQIKVQLIISIVCVLLVVCLLVFVFIYCWLKKKKRQSLKAFENDPLVNISYGELLKATNGFSPNNMIGEGGFGSVYKGILEPHKKLIAVKVFSLENREASKSFMAECEILRNVRHRNLVKIITACSGVDYQGNDFKALAYEFMPNGSLEDWLHSDPTKSGEQRKSLTLSQRLNVVIDVASALDYLHNHNESPIIHCDLKPSNILLDKDMTAHVGDFGLSRLAAEHSFQVPENHTSSIGIKGTIGYAAPEYGMGSKVTTQGDVYSFGILLLEIFTAKRPTDAGFKDGLNLNQFVKMALPERVMDIVEYGLVSGEEEERTTSSNTLLQTRRDKIHECLVSMLKVGVMCSELLPIKRIKIHDALNKLHDTRKLLLKDGR
ncbi:Serine/threonine protein kinase [Parasponia andersonii]|uniref:non-specific serine/threonine protein kinase n=1 Tax=Parasponia andersonii TaxID=3476 RepID=A0A2P5CM32_PARAD|nr:Serine/threonine protein kinase [Parasponia andersonii]